VDYFKHAYASNSDLKKIVARFDQRTEMDNLDAIFDFGSQFHAGILEPHKMDTSGLTPEQIELIKQMSKTFWKDKMCSDIAMASDFKREHEFYRKERFEVDGEPGTGITARCKADGCSRRMQVILELKGLGITTNNSFLESLLHHDYDQASTWYLNTASSESTRYKYQLIVGISKKQPDRLFKLLVDWDHANYKSGLVKVNRAKYIWKNVYGFK